MARSRDLNEGYRDNYVGDQMGWRERDVLLLWWDKYNDEHFKLPYWWFLENTKYDPKTDELIFHNNKRLSIADANAGKTFK